MKFKDNGEFKYDKASTIITDLLDGYLSNISYITYKTESNGGLFELLNGENKEDIDELGSHLLKTLSSANDIILAAQDENRPGSCDKEFALYRLQKLTPLISKLSDEYSLNDDYYATYYHEDILEICQAIKDVEA